jgi:hypothetical protein
VLLDVLHSHKWLAFKRLAAQNLAGFRLAGQYVKLSSAKGLQGWVSFRTREEAERYAEAARRELEKLGIDAAPKVVRRGPSYDVVFDEKTLRRLAEVDEASKAGHREAGSPLYAAHSRRTRRRGADGGGARETGQAENRGKREEAPMPKTTAPKAVDRVVFQLVDGVASMRLRLTYVMKGEQKDSHCKRRGVVFCVGGG